MTSELNRSVRLSHNVLLARKMEIKAGRNNPNSLPLRKSRKIRNCKFCNHPINPGELYAPNRKGTYVICELCYSGKMR